MKTMVTSESEDEQLVRAFQRGDEVAFSIFVQRRQDRVYRVAMQPKKFWRTYPAMCSPYNPESLADSRTLRNRTWVTRTRPRPADL